MKKKIYFLVNTEVPLHLHTFFTVPHILSGGTRNVFDLQPSKIS